MGDAAFSHYQEMPKARPGGRAFGVRTRRPPHCRRRVVECG